MEQYIPKSALVAELEDWRYKITTGVFSIPLEGRDRADAALEYELLGRVKDFIDTLEVKEVDLDKEIDLVEDKYYGFDSLSRADIIEIAKHFFELGLKVAQKGK